MDEVRFADSGDNNICFLDLAWEAHVRSSSKLKQILVAYNRRSVFGSAMALGDGRVTVPKHSGDRAAYDVAASEDDRASTCKVYGGRVEEANHTSGCAWSKEGV